MDQCCREESVMALFGHRSSVCCKTACGLHQCAVYICEMTQEHDGRACLM